MELTHEEVVVHPLPETENIAPDPAVVVAGTVGHEVGDSVVAGGASVVSGTLVAGMVPIVGHEVGVVVVPPDPEVVVVPPDPEVVVVSGTSVGGTGEAVSSGGAVPGGDPLALKQSCQPLLVTLLSVDHSMVLPSAKEVGTEVAVLMSTLLISNTSYLASSSKLESTATVTSSVMVSMHS